MSHDRVISSKIHGCISSFHFIISSHHFTPSSPQNTPASNSSRVLLEEFDLPIARVLASHSSTCAANTIELTGAGACPDGYEHTYVDSKVISSSYTVQEDLPLGTNGAQLLADNGYKDAKRK